MEQITLVNTSKRAFVFPTRHRLPGGEVIARLTAEQGLDELPLPDGTDTVRLTLDAGERATVPDWYFEAICAEEGLRARMNRIRDGIAVMRGAETVRVPSSADAERAAHEAGKRAAAAEKRVSDLLSQREEQAASARALEARVKELEAALAAKTKDKKKTDEA